MQNEAIIEGVLRACGIGAVATLLGYCGAAAFAAPRRATRRVAWGLAIACFVTPPLLEGYAYANFTGISCLPPGLREGAYALLVIARLVPVTATIWLMAPVKISAESWFCLRLLWPRLGRRDRLRHLWELSRGGPLTASLAVFGVAYIIAFTEFEVASFLGVSHWTVAIFDAQVGGLPILATLRQVAPPAGVITLLAVMLIWWGRKTDWGHRAPAPRARPGRLLCQRAGLVWFAGATAMAVFVPASLVLHGAAQGVAGFLGSFALQRELGHSLLVAALASALACGAARALVTPTGRATRRPRTRLAGTALLLLPGLLGHLVLGLCVLTLLQAPLVWRLRDTPLPLIAAATLVALPLAALMQLLLMGRSGGEDIFAARLLGHSPRAAVRRHASDIHWVRHARPVFWAGGLLLCTLFYDVTLASLLAPLQMPLVMPRVYNFMHYGQSQILSASLLACMLTPVAALGLASMFYRWGRARHAATLEM